MHKLILAGAAVCFLSSTALAQTAVSNASGTGIATSRSTAGAVAVSGQGGGGGNGGNVTINSSVPATQTINQNVASTVSGSTTQHVVTSGTSTVRTNPAVFAPGLSAAGLETCLGSASGGVSIAGLGLTGGSSYPDEGCQARLDSRTLWSYGLRRAAILRLCQREAIYQSMPEVCGKYMPRAVTPVGYPAPVAPLSVYASAGGYKGGQIMLVEGSTGRDRLCNDYNEGKQRCRVWADATPSRPKKHRIVAAVPTPAPAPVQEATATVTP